MTSDSSFIVENLAMKANERSILITPTYTKQSPTVYVTTTRKEN